MALLAVLISIFSLVCTVYSDWSQQYGDYRSTNYAEIDPSSDLINISESWNYTNPGNYSYMYNSPAISDKGVIFLPFLNYAPPDFGKITYDLQVRAMAPNGSIIWITENLGSDKTCAVIFLTNAVYLSQRNMVVIGWTCAAAFPFYEKHGQMVGIDASTGKVLWKSKKLNDSANDLSRISSTEDVIYVSGGYYCHKDGLPLQPNAAYKTQKLVSKRQTIESNASKIYAFSVSDGRMLWSLEYNQVGCTSQTRLYPLANGNHLVTFPTHLLPNIYLGGKLLALECTPSGDCTKRWLSDVEVGWSSTFAFSDHGVLYGGYGFAGMPDLIFGLDVETGQKVFSNLGYCQPGVYPSGPVVDEHGHAYYSCGNSVFAVNSKGDLLWKTDMDNTDGYVFYSNHRFPPALVPHPPPNSQSGDFLVAMNTNSTHLYALSTVDGSIVGSIPVPVLDGDVGISEPPFVAQNRIYWIKVHYFIKFYLFSTSLEMLFDQ